MPDPRWSDLDRPPLDVRSLRRGLLDGGLWRDIRVAEQTESTNADAARLARLGEPEGIVVVAEHQIAGRGRLGRTWSAPARSGLMFSVLLRPAEVAAARWPLLPLLVGVAVARTVSRLADVEVGLKWPNDLMLAERKLGGILAERVEDQRGDAAAVVGVGLNVSLRETELPVPAATSLAIAHAACTFRDPLLRAVLRALAEDYAQWRQNPATLVEVYRKHCVTIGREVRAELPGGAVIEGRASDVDADGSLVIEGPAGRSAVTAGDVVHLR